MASWGRDSGKQFNPNSTYSWYGFGDDDGRPRRYSWREWQGDDVSYVVATCWLTFLTSFALIMVIKSPTLLRLYAGSCTFLGFTIAILGLICAKGLVNMNWFWAWNFLAEGLAVVSLCLAIINVASGFYIMKGTRNFYWKLSIAMTALYGATTTVTVIYYVYHKIIHRAISATELQDIRSTVIAQNDWNATSYYAAVANYDIRKGRDSISSGLSNWEELSRHETKVFAWPSSTSYLVHQYVMLAACFWACLYLFIPLLRHHRKTASAVERPVDSDMVAIGVWYLSCICTLATLYFIVNIIFTVNPSLIYNPQMQAFDLCLRITIGPILFTPAPKRLIKFYRQHLRSKNSSTAGRNNSDSGGRSGDRSTPYKSSGNDWRFANFSSPDSTRVGSGNDKYGSGPDNYGSAPRGSLDVVPDRIQDKHQNAINPSNTFSRVKLFQTRDRGCSVESSRVLIKDYETVSTHSRYAPEERSDSFQNYSDFEMNHHPLQTSEGLYCEVRNFKPRDPLQNAVRSIATNEPQQPKPVITAQQVRSSNGNASPQISTTNASDKKDDISTNLNSDSDQLSAAANNHLTATEPGLAVDPLSVIDTPLEQLTGLQRQLAEHRSALLPQAIAFKAYHEDLAESKPYGHIIRESPEPSDPNHSGSGTRPSMSYMRRHPNENAFGANNNIYSKSGWGSLEPESRSSSSHIGGTEQRFPSNRSPPESPKAIVSSGNNDNDIDNPHSKPRENKTKDIFMSAFSKANIVKSDVPPETSPGPTFATVEELTQCSVMNGDYKDKLNSFGYSDPYDDQSSFKRPIPSPKAPPVPRLSSSKSRDSLPTQNGSKVSTSKARSKSDVAHKDVGKETVVPLVLVKSSLPPPPRQSWQRSKSKGSVHTVGTIETNHVGDIDPASSGETNSSSSSFSTSPKNSSPRLEDYQAKSSSHTFLPQGSSSPILGYRGNSLEYNDSRASRERERATPLSPTLSGLSPRLDFNRNQRSVDNLASTYYYKRATDGKSPAQSPQRQARELSNIPVPHDASGRNSPSSTYHGRGGSSPSMTPSESFQSGYSSEIPTPIVSNSHSQNQLLAEDPWTQAMVNRAQSHSNPENSSLTRNGSAKGRSTNPVAY